MDEFFAADFAPHKARDTQAVLDRLGIKTVTHPPYSPDIGLCDYHIFRSMRNLLDGKQLKNERDLEDVIEDLGLAGF